MFLVLSVNVASAFIFVPLGMAFESFVATYGAQIFATAGAGTILYMFNNNAPKLAKIINDYFAANVDVIIKDPQTGNAKKSTVTVAMPVSKVAEIVTANPSLYPNINADLYFKARELTLSSPFPVSGEYIRYKSPPGVVEAYDNSIWYVAGTGNQLLAHEQTPDTVGLSDGLHPAGYSFTYTYYTNLDPSHYGQGCVLSSASYNYNNPSYTRIQAHSVDTTSISGLYNMCAPSHIAFVRTATLQYIATLQPINVDAITFKNQLTKDGHVNVAENAEFQTLVKNNFPLVSIYDAPDVDLFSDSYPLQNKEVITWQSYGYDANGNYTEPVNNLPATVTNINELNAGLSAGQAALNNGLVAMDQKINTVQTGMSNLENSVLGLNDIATSSNTYLSQIKYYSGESYSNLVAINNNTQFLTGYLTYLPVMRTGIDNTKAAVDSVKSSVDSARDTLVPPLISIQNSTAGVKTSVDGVRSATDGVKTSVDGVKTAVDSVGASVTTGNGLLEGIKTGVLGIPAAISALPQAIKDFVIPNDNAVPATPDNSYDALIDSPQKKDITTDILNYVKVNSPVVSIVKTFKLNATNPLCSFPVHLPVMNLDFSIDFCRYEEMLLALGSVLLMFSHVAAVYIAIGKDVT